MLSELAGYTTDRSALYHRRSGGRSDPLVHLFVYVAAPHSGMQIAPGVAFVAAEGSRFVVFRDKPPPEPRPWQRFLLLHELSHVSTEGAGIHVARWRLFLTAMNSAVVFAIVGWSAVPWWVWITVAVLVGHAIYRVIAFEMWFEMYADMYAFENLKDDDERQRVIALMQREVELSSTGPVIGISRGLQALHRRIWSDRLTAVELGRRKTLFNRQGGHALDPSALPFIACAAAAAWLGFHIPVLSHGQLQLVLIWCVACQGCSVVMNRKAQAYEASVRRSLQSRVAP